MKRQPDRQDQRKIFNGIIPMKEMGYLIKVRIEKIEIFKDEEDHASGDNAYDEVELSPFPLRPFDEECGCVINGNGEA